MILLHKLAALRRYDSGEIDTEELLKWGDCGYKESLELIQVLYGRGRLDAVLCVINNLLRTNLATNDRVVILQLRRDILQKMKDDEASTKFPFAEIAKTHSDTNADVIFTITSCKRLNLFIRTVDSILQCFLDTSRVKRWICIDDNSCKSDRAVMAARYPFFEFIWKGGHEKGHAHSMNLIVDIVQASGLPYWFHCEDDWRFLSRKKYFSDAISILEDDYATSNIMQCLINRNYMETPEDKVLGGFVKFTRSFLRYYEHDHAETAEKFAVLPPYHGAAYWPHFSLRPSLMRVSMLANMRKRLHLPPSHPLFPGEESHFELEFARRYFLVGFRSAFFEDVDCVHIGRLTSEQYSPLAINAYVLNDQMQFSRDQPKLCLKTWIVNLDRRLERFTNLVKRYDELGSETWLRWPAVDGRKITGDSWIRALFRDNDYNYRCGIVGCALSHLLLWTQLLDEGEDESCMFLIMEDDVTITNVTWWKLVHNWLKSNQDFDVLFIGHHKRKEEGEKDTIVSRPTNIPLSIDRKGVSESLGTSYGGTFGYVITSKGSANLLKFVEKRRMTNAIDTVMQLAADELDIRYCEPCIVASKMGDENSDIQHEYNSIKWEVDSEEETGIFNILEIQEHV